MTLGHVILAALLLVALGVIAVLLRDRRRGADRELTPSARRILFPFAGDSLSESALDAALRIARAEEATLVPAYLALVPLSVKLDTPLRSEAETALPLLEAIERRAATQGVPVDSRIEVGRTYRHAFRELLEHERFDRLVAAGRSNGDGFSADDVAWLLEHAPGEILILRPDRERRQSGLKATGAVADPSNNGGGSASGGGQPPARPGVGDAASRR